MEVVVQAIVWHGLLILSPWLSKLILSRMHDAQWCPCVPSLLHFLRSFRIKLQQQTFAAALKRRKQRRLSFSACQRCDSWCFRCRQCRVILLSWKTAHEVLPFWLPVCVSPEMSLKGIFFIFDFFFSFYLKKKTSNIKRNLQN